MNTAQNLPTPQRLSTYAGWLLVAVGLGLAGMTVLGVGLLIWSDPEGVVGLFAAVGLGVAAPIAAVVFGLLLVRARNQRLGLNMVRGVLLAPSVWLLLFVALVTRARLSLGHWPFPKTDDRLGRPFEGTFDWDLYYALDPNNMVLHYYALALGALVVALLTVAGPALAATMPKEQRRKLLPSSIVFAISMVAVWTLWVADPGQYWEWYLD